MNTLPEPRDVHVIGYGGKGGGGGGGLSEDPDSLKSVAYAQMVMALCEGEIEGPAADLAKCVYLDGTPMQNGDGTWNFDPTGAQLAWTPGTQGQSALPNVSGVESETAVGAEVKNSTPVTRAITAATTDAVRVTVSVPSLYQTTSKGKIIGTSVDLVIYIQSNGGGYNAVLTDTITGKTTGKYQRSYLVQLGALAKPVNIRVWRATADNGSGILHNQTSWDSYTEITNVKLRYPNTALLAARIDSTRFNHVPTIGVLTRLMRVRVPANYTPATRVYSGAWDGTFKMAWSDNPAWCFYDLVTSTRYGLGKYIPEAQVDKWALYQIAQYCDQLVSDGRGGTEPRFTCNLYLQTRQEAYTVLQQFVGIFRSMLYWAGGSLTTVQDAPADPVALFTNANVVDGTFTYAGAPLNQRHTVALVTWNNPGNLYRQQVEYVEDLDGIARFGVIQTEIVAMGCTSQSQAQRIGRWLLYTERMESETCSFAVGLEGALARPGQIIQVADANRAGERRGGRVLQATATSVQIDAPVTLQPGIVYTLSVIAADGSLMDATVQSVGAATTTDTLALTAALPSIPSASAIWVLASPNLQPQTFRVLSVTEAERNHYAIVAIAHNPAKYAAVENDTRVLATPISAFTTPPPAPTGLTVREWQDTAQAGVVRVDLVFGWDAVPGASGYELAYTVDDSAPKTVQVQSNSYDEIVHAAGHVEAKVRAINVAGIAGPYATAATDTVTPAPVPQQLQYLSVFPLDGLTYGTGPGSKPATAASVFCYYADSSAGVVEPLDQFNTDIVTVRSSKTAASVARSVPGGGFQASNTLTIPINPLSSPEHVTGTVVNQYGGQSTSADIILPQTLANRYQVSATDSHACFTTQGCAYWVKTSSNFSAAIPISSYTGADILSISASAITTTGYTAVAIGTPYHGGGHSSDGINDYYSTWSVDISHNDLAVGETRLGGVLITVTFQGGGQVVVPVNFTASRVDPNFGYRPA